MPTSGHPPFESIVHTHKMLVGARSASAVTDSSKPLREKSR